jgi:predicted anti-sigma-YlaC factor YlaD
MRPLHRSLTRTLVLLPLLCGCSLFRSAAVDNLSEAFIGGRAAEVYASDDDPELVRDALPFSLKTGEILIAQSPESVSLRLAAASGFVQYAAAFLDGEAQQLLTSDLNRARELQRRAGGLYLRGSDHALAGLELSHPGLRGRLRADPAAALAAVGRTEAPLLFWAGAGLAGAISVSGGNPALTAELPLAGALAQRALELDEAWGDGAIHEFFIVFEGGRTGALGGSEDRAREHFRRTLELTGGRKASPYVALATAVSVPRQDLAEYKGLLERALAVDASAEPRWRLSNTLSQRKARWLLDHAADYFFEEEEQ